MNGAAKDDEKTGGVGQPLGDNGKKAHIYAHDIFRIAAETNFYDPKTALDFDITYKGKLDPSRASKRNRGDKKRHGSEILLLVAKKEDWRKENVKWSDEKTREFLGWLLKTHHELLEVKAADKTTSHLSPLHMALLENNVAFVDAVMKQPKLTNIKTVLSEKGLNGNALDIAVQHSLSSVAPLASQCKDNFPEMFGEEEGSTMTPLHRCMELDSAAKEHKDASNSSTNEEPAMDDDSSSSSSDDESRDQMSSKRQKTRPTPASLPHGSEASPSTQNITDKVPMSPAHSSNMNEVLAAVKELIKGHDSVLWYRVLGETPYLKRMKILRERLHENEQKRIRELKERQSKGEQGPKVPSEEEQRETFERKFQDIVAEDPIALYIRSYCIGRFPRDKIMESLYNTGEERHIEFDLGGIPYDEISVDYLQQLSRHLKFESILKYVALPRFTIEASPRTKRAKEKNDGLPAHRGRSDLVAIFKWLRENGVRKIVKLIVVDDQDPCHANISIEAALKGFEVEIWDWKKLDLGLEAIYQSTSCVKEVSLYCSGNGAVLTGWASPQGLPNKKRFPKLEKVVVYIRQGYESHKRIGEYIAAFEDSMKENTKTSEVAIEENMDANGLGDAELPKMRKIAVDCILDDGEISYASEFQSNMGHLQPNNPWVDCVKRLATFLESFPRSSKIPRIKVAIIDDGVDVSMAGLDDKIAIGKSFSPYANSKDLMSPYFVSTSNHGTCMAYLICELCPMVELYIAKLDQRQSSGRNDRRISIKSATEAIQWATKSKVDIISMSWTIEKAITEDKDMGPFDAAVKKANDNNILMLCATSDQGSQTSDHCYPGDFDGCIAIGSATETGDPMAWVNAKRVAYLFPGVNIPFPDSRNKTFTQESGSSVATAAATGLASLLIHAGRLARDDNYQYFKDSRNMQTVFDNLCKSPGKFPLVLERLENRLKDEINKLGDDRYGKDYDLSSLMWNESYMKSLDAIIERLKEN